MSRTDWPTASPAMFPSVVLPCLLVLSLIVGAVTHRPLPGEIAAVCAVLWIATQWTRLIPLARLFSGIAAAVCLAMWALWPGALDSLMTALVQGTGFAALMLCLGFLRDPVRRAPLTQRAAAYLLSYPPRRRYGTILAGAQFMALMFNVGFIAMIGDLTRTSGPRDGQDDPDRRSMVVAAMRGAAVVSIWSPLSLGFAIVTTGVAGIEPLPLIALAFAFSALMLGVSALWPMLPPEARPGIPTGPLPPRRHLSAMLSVLGISSLLLGLAVACHLGLDVSFTMASIIVLPLTAILWLIVESGGGREFRTRLTGAFETMGSMRSEGALFLSANVIGAALSVMIQANPLWSVLSGPAFAGLPTLLALLVLIPLAAALYLPNSVMVVLAAQIFGPTLLGQDHPLALGLTFCIGWAIAICVNPISAMSLLAARFTGVSPSRLAYGWNIRFALVSAVMAALWITAVYQWES